MNDVTGTSSRLAETRSF